MSLDVYSDSFVYMASNGDRYRVQEKPDGYGTKTGECGDRVEFYLSARDGRIRMITFLVSGCLNTFACANTVCHLVDGKSISDCWYITPEHIYEFFQTLPGDHHNCAELVIGAFYLTLSDYNRNVREPWRVDYQQKR